MRSNAVQQAVLAAAAAAQTAAATRLPMRTSPASPVDAHHAHVVSNQHLLLDLLQQPAHHAQQAAARRQWGGAAAVTAGPSIACAAFTLQAINLDAHKVGLRSHDLCGLKFTDKLIAPWMEGTAAAVAGRVARTWPIAIVGTSAAAG